MKESVRAARLDDLRTLSTCAERLNPVIAAQAKEKQIEAGGAVRQKSDKAVIDTKKEIAKLAGVSHDTVAKFEKIEAQAKEKRNRTKNDLSEI